jgi:GAF domain-containing protein
MEVGDLVPEHFDRMPTPDDTLELDDAGAGFDAVADAITGLRELLDDRIDVDSALDQLCHDLTRTIARADAAGVTLIRRGRAVTTSRTDPVVDVVDHAQYAAGEGPCVEAAVTRQVVRVDDAGTRTAFPAFWLSNADTGMHGFLSAPLSVDGDHVGALNLYSRDDVGFDRVDAAVMRIHVAAAEAVLVAAARARADRGKVEGLVLAMESRGAIEQCKGALAVVLHITSDRAFDLLKWRSQETNVAVRALCEQLVRDVAAVDLVDGPTKDQFGKIFMSVHTRVPAA